MEKLTALTLMDMLPTELIPALSRVPNLTNLDIHTREYTFKMKPAYYDSNDTINIECVNCTPEFLDQLLPALPQQNLVCIKSLTLKHERKYIHREDWQCNAQPIPSCLLELIPKLENLDTLTLTTVLDPKLSELMSKLSTIPSTKSLTLQITLNTSQYFYHFTLEKKCTSYTCTCALPEVIDQLLQFLPQQHMAKIQTFEVNYCSKLKSLPPCLSELIPRMTSLTTLIMNNVLDTSLTVLKSALPKVFTLKNLTLFYYPAQFGITFLNNSIEAIACHCCTTESIDQILQQILYENDENTDSHSTLPSPHKTLTACDIHYRTPQPLPCLIQSISRMERLNTLTLNNILDTSLTKLIPSIFRVPTLRNFTLQSDTEKLRIQFPTDNFPPTGIIESTTKFLSLYLPQLPQETIAHTGSLTVTNSLTECASYRNLQRNPQPLPPYVLDLVPKMKSLNSLTLKETILDDTLIALIPMLSIVPVQRNLSLTITLGSKGRLSYGTFENVCTCTSCTYTCTTQEIDLLLQLLPQQHMAQIQSFKASFYTPEPLPHIRCLSKLIFKMEQLNTLILENIVLRTIKFGPRCTSRENSIDCKVTIIFCNKFIESVECQYDTAEFIDQVLSQIPMQSLAYVKMLSICNEEEEEKDEDEDSDYYDEDEYDQYYEDDYEDESSYQLLPVPPCLPKMILRMEKLDTLTLENILDTSLTRQIWLLSRVPNLRNLTLQTLDSEGITLLCQWLPTCRLEKLKLPSLSPKHIEMVSRTLTTVSSLKTLDIQRSKFTFQSMKPFVSMLQQNQSLTEVNISDCGIDSDSACCLAEALHHNTTLRKLDMSESPVRAREREELAIAVSCDGAIAMAEALHYNTTLRKLDMSYSPVREKGAFAMAEMLKHNTTLKELDLSTVEISCDGAISMAEALHHNATLRKLDVSWNPIGERGALAMAEMLKHNTVLEELDLRIFFSDDEDDESSSSCITALIESLAINQHLKKLVIYKRYEDFVLLLCSVHEERIHLDY